MASHTRSTRSIRSTTSSGNRGRVGGEPPARSQPPPSLSNSSRSTAAQSNATSRATITSAAALAAKPVKFQEWANAVHLDINIQDDIPMDSTFDPIRDIQRASRKFPRWLSDKESPAFHFQASKYSAQIHDISDRLKRVVVSVTNDADETPEVPSADTATNGADETPEIELVDEPDLALGADIGVLLQLSRYHCHASRRVDLPPNEAELRFNIDTLIAHVYDGEVTNRPIWHTAERQLKLPYTNLTGINVASTTVDAVDLMFFGVLPAYRPDDRTHEALTCISQTQPTRYLNVVHCVAGYKPDTNGQPQALMGLVSGLYQRRLMRMESHFVFGIIQRLGDSLVVVAGCWQNGKICVYRMGYYLLAEPTQVIQFYLLIRGIKQLGESYRNDISNAGFLSRAWKVPNTPDPTWAPKKPNIQEGEEDPQAPSMEQIMGAFEQWDYEEKVMSFLDTIQDPPTDAASESTDSTSSDKIPQD